jgi:hypothetical protein
VVPTACNRRVPLPEYTDRLSAGWSNVEDYRQRLLLTFERERDAQSYADRVLDLYRSCPEEASGDDGRLVSVHDSDLGDSAGVVSALSTYLGTPRPGLETLYVVRVGVAVLLALTSDEAGGGPDPAQQAADHRAEDALAIAGVVEAMGMFRDDYPSEPPFGPEGFGKVTLGLPRDALLALPAVHITDGTDRCETFAAAGVTGGLERGHGVIYLQVRADLETPERVHVGSTSDEVRAAYPAAQGDEVFLTAEPPGFGDRYYRFDLGPDGRVTEIKLVSADQSCVS